MTGVAPLYVSSSQSAVSSIVSVPCAMTMPSTSEEAAMAPRIRSQSAGVSIELSTAIKSMTSTSSPVVRSAPVRVGRLTPALSLLVAMVPPVATRTRRAMARILPHSHFGMMGE
jgi:hypothetical protein